ASMLSGSVSRSARPGRVLLACGAGWGAALALVGLVSPLPAVLALLAVAGAADTWAVISRGTVVQSSTPDAVRGRVAALEQVVGVAGPQVGGFRAGLVAAASGGSAAILSGGLACLAAVALLAVRLPELRAFAPVRGARTT
ncbi:MAG TPA: MFS transporter, partial [Actinomycetes bacterium]